MDDLHLFFLYHTVPSLSHEINLPKNGLDVMICRLSWNASTPRHTFVSLLAVIELGQKGRYVHSLSLRQFSAASILFSLEFSAADFERQASLANMKTTCQLQSLHHLEFITDTNTILKPYYTEAATRKPNSRIQRIVFLLLIERWYEISEISISVMNRIKHHKKYSIHTLESTQILSHIKLSNLILGFRCGWVS